MSCRSLASHSQVIIRIKRDGKTKYSTMLYEFEVFVVFLLQPRIRKSRMFKSRHEYKFLL